MQANLEVRFPNKGMDRLERRAANYLDPTLKGVHLGLYAMMRSTKLEMEERWGPLISEVAGPQRDREDGVEVGNLSPTSKLLKVTQAQGVRDLDSTPLQHEMRLFEATDSPGRPCDILQWWKMFEPNFPMLAKLARMIFAIPASSAKSERTFSKAGRMVTSLRGNLAPDKVEELTIVNENGEKATWFKEHSHYKFDKEEDVLDFDDDFNHIGVRFDYSRMADDLEEQSDAAEYEDFDDDDDEEEEL